MGHKVIYFTTPQFVVPGWGEIEAHICVEFKIMIEFKKLHVNVQFVLCRFFVITS